MELRPTEPQYDMPQDTNKIIRPPAPRSEDIVLSDREIIFLTALLEDDPWQKTRERSGLRRDAYRQRQNIAASFSQELARMSNLALGIATKYHPILRENVIKQTLGPMLVSTRDDMEQLNRQAPALAASTQLVDILRTAAEEQIAPAVAAIKDDREQYELLRKFDSDENFEDKTAGIKNFVWSSAFYFAHGGYGNHEPVLDQLEEKVSTGKFDTFIAEELFDNAEIDNESEIGKLQELAEHMAGGASDWKARLFSRIDLFPAAVQKQIIERRQTIGKELRENIDACDVAYGPILRGIHLDVRAELQEIHALIRQKQLRKLGKTVVESTAPPTSVRRRWNPSDTLTDNAADITMPESQRAPLVVAENVYNYQHAESTDKKIEDMLAEYAGNNPKLLEALRESTTHIAERFGRDERGNGIKKVRGSANKAELLWEFKPKEAVGVGQVGRAIDQTRMFFVVKEDTIHIVDVFARTKYNEKMKNLGLGR